MVEHGTNPVEESVAQVLSGWQLVGIVAPQVIAGLVSEGVAHWQMALPDGSDLHLLRFHAPLVQREEVFLGNVLLNDFLFKTVPLMVAGLGVSQCTPVAADLQDAYFLVRGELDLEALPTALQREVAVGLQELLFGEENLPRGIHGSVRRMLGFFMSWIEPFPVFAVPRSCLADLLRVVVGWVRRLADEDGAEALAAAEGIAIEKARSRRINVILSNLAFFFARDGTEMQSPYRFLDRALRTGRLPAGPICEAFNLDSHAGLTKETFQAATAPEGSVNWPALRAGLGSFLDHVEGAIAAGVVEFEVPNLVGKMSPLEPGESAEHLLAGVQVGYKSISPLATTRPAMACRFCGHDVALVPDKNIIGGSRTGSRFNQSVRYEDARFCPRCGVAAYLANKRLGMRFNQARQPIPRLYNVVFHHGHHDDIDVTVLERQVDAVLAGARGQAKTVDELRRSLAEIRGQVEAAQAGAKSSSPGDLERTFMADLEEWIPAALDVAAQMQTDVQSRVFPMGVGPSRLLVFVLPQFQPGREEGLDFVQQRFSQSRLAAFTLLALLRGLCNCEGPYYFQSLPILSTSGMVPDTFYVRNRPERASEVLRLYGAITSFARRVSSPPHRKGHSPLAEWVLLAERIVDDPIGVFSEVLRDSPVRAGDDFRDYPYRRLSNNFVPGMGVVDSTEYLALYRRLEQLQEEVN